MKGKITIVLLIIIIYICAMSGIELYYCKTSEVINFTYYNKYIKGIRDIKKKDIYSRNAFSYKTYRIKYDNDLDNIVKTKSNYIWIDKSLIITKEEKADIKQLLNKGKIVIIVEKHLTSKKLYDLLYIKPKYDQLNINSEGYGSENGKPIKFISEGIRITKLKDDYSFMLISSASNLDRKKNTIEDMLIDTSLSKLPTASFETLN